MISRPQSFTLQDETMMREALRLARQGLYSTRPNPMVGAVLVQQEQIVGRGAHLRAGEPHAEVHALNEAQALAQGATLYVTLEPCSHKGRTPPCSEAVISAGVARVVIAALDPNPQVAGSGVKQLQEAGIEVAWGLLESEARELNAGFFSRMERGRPYVRAKVAMTLDGRTALPDGQSQWITGAAARADGHLLRAQAGAILTGIGTLLHDDPLLTVRHPIFEESAMPQPLRVVADSQLRTPPDARFFSVPHPVILAHALSQEDALERGSSTSNYYPEQVTLHAIPDSEGRADLTQLLQLLASQYEVNDLHVEGGAALIGALLELKLIDELVCYMAPVLLGDPARGVALLPDIIDLSQKIQTRVDRITPVGEDWRIDAKMVYDSL